MNGSDDCGFEYARRFLSLPFMRNATTRARVIPLALLTNLLLISPFRLVNAIHFFHVVNREGVKAM